MWHTNVAQKARLLGLYDAEVYGFFSDINELADVQPCR